MFLPIDMYQDLISESRGLNSRLVNNSLSRPNFSVILVITTSYK